MILDLGKGRRIGDLLVAAPLLQMVLSDESFGLVFSPSATAAFASATAIKTEDLQPSVDLSDDEDEGVLDEELQQGQQNLLHEMAIDPALTLIPEGSLIPTPLVSSQQPPIDDPGLSLGCAESNVASNA